MSSWATSPINCKSSSRCRASRPWSMAGSSRSLSLPTSASRATAAMCWMAKSTAKSAAGTQPQAAAIGEQDIDAEVARAADAYGFVKTDGKPDVEKWLKSVTEQPGRRSIFMFATRCGLGGLKKLVGAKVEVTDEDLRKGFDSNYGERVEVQAIVFSDLRQAKKCGTWPATTTRSRSFLSWPSSTRSSLRRAPTAARCRQFAGMAAHADRRRGVQLKAGELSGIVAIDGQFIVLRCQGRTRPVQTDFNAVRGELVKTSKRKSSVC